MDPKKDIFATKEGKRDYVIALVVIAIFSLVIYQFVFKSEAVDDISTAADTSDVVVTTSSDEAKEDRYLYTNSTTYAATTIQTEAPYEGTKATAVVISDMDTGIPKVADSISKPLDTATETKIVPQTRDSLATAASNKTGRLPESVVEKKEPIKKAVATTNLAINCVVVVGVFKEEANKTAVIEKLKSFGHSHAEGILRDNLNYVGVPVECNNEQQRQKLLKQLNQSFGIDSWVMRLKVQE